MQKQSRREFLRNCGRAASAAALFTLAGCAETKKLRMTPIPSRVPSGGTSLPPSEKLNIACVGCGGMGAADLARVADQNIIALCDVDDVRAAQVFERCPNVPKYKDFRVMLDKEHKNIDAVIVSTPDHTHAVIAMMAIKMGKHVYCQKPLCHDIYETRTLTEQARRHKVVTQMGTQLHGNDALKTTVETLKSGLIGNVRQVHLWSNKPETTPIGTDRPVETPPVPETLDWDLWLGPAPYRPYHPNYVPFHWRAYWDFGSGRLGDMGCHIFDVAWWALNLDAPKTVEAQRTKINDETYPIASVVRYEFGPRGKLPPVTLTWSDGGIYPWHPEGFEPNRKFPAEGGLYIGDKGILLAPHGGGPRLIPESKMADFKKPPQMFSREHNHWQQWVAACKGQTKALSNFDYAGPLTEAVLLGNIAIKTGEKLHWDSKNLKITNFPEANNLLRRPYRQGWTL